MENLLFCNPNIRELVENVNIGPQSEVKELIDDFNDRYIVNDINNRNNTTPVIIFFICSPCGF